MKKSTNVRKRVETVKSKNNEKEKKNKRQTTTNKGLKHIEKRPHSY